MAGLVGRGAPTTCGNRHLRGGPFQGGTARAGKGKGNECFGRNTHHCGENTADVYGTHRTPSALIKCECNVVVRSYTEHVKSRQHCSSYERLLSSIIRGIKGWGTNGLGLKSCPFNLRMSCSYYKTWFILQ